jgi:predicted CXXCH cytochrome family protein
VSCHGSLIQELRRPGAVQHQPAAERRCLECHEAHVSSFAGLARQGQPALCAGCHEVNTPAMESAHLGLAEDLENCLECHAPHSASGQGLFWPNRHPPFDERRCDECHDETAD